MNPNILSTKNVLIKYELLVLIFHLTIFLKASTATSVQPTTASQKATDQSKLRWL